MAKFQCPICSKTFKTNKAMHEHFKEQHVGKPTVKGAVYALQQGCKPEQLCKHGYPDEIIKKALKVMKDGSVS